MSFEIDEFRKYCLLNGLDDIGLTMQHADSIEAFEQQYYERLPWLK
jgi:3-isopropylmalate/(R)-2-methylmalate dehydratase small subunit